MWFTVFRAGRGGRHQISFVYIKTKTFYGGAVLEQQGISNWRRRIKDNKIVFSSLGEAIQMIQEPTSEA